MTEKDVSFKPGVWKGKYLDAYGYRGEIKLNTESRGAEIMGNFELLLASEDEPQVLSGNIMGIQENDAVQLKLTIEKSKETIEYKAHIMNAGSYATQCMGGMITAPENSDFGGGVWIAWRFKFGNQ
jgi:hypothetical protein